MDGGYGPPVSPEYGSEFDSLREVPVHYIESFPSHLPHALHHHAICTFGLKWYHHITNVNIKCINAASKQTRFMRVPLCSWWLLCGLI